MKYVCLCYSDEEKYERMPESAAETIFAEQVAYDAELRARGNVIASESLESVRMAKSVRLQDGRVSVTDGPFAETKEQLGGFFLIEAEDMDDAVRIASKFPSLRAGTIELRPVWDIRQHVGDQRMQQTAAAEAPAGMRGI